MSGQIIFIEPQYERILYFLYPNYSVEEYLRKQENFILRKDITSPRDRLLLENYDNYIVISTKLYDVHYDREYLKQAAIDFRRKWFKTRKRQLNELDGLEPEDFIDNLVSFMFTEQLNIADDEQVMDLFNAYGSASFPALFFEKCKTIPLPKLISTMYTFISKVMADSGSVFYKRKFQAYGNKIKENLPYALDSFAVTSDDHLGLKQVQFFQNLVR